MNGTQKDVGIKPEHNAETSGFAKPSPTEYNAAHGRQSNAPTSGGPRSKADVLIAKGKAYGRSK